MTRLRIIRLGQVSELTRGGFDITVTEADLQPYRPMA